ncbi:MAG TPA: urate hydroxylase PuuD, partial [Opitutus sp.]|nr:urate hydroxylase PuuD [Opitutus sp.]
MDAHLIEFLGMLLRWLHIIAGIAWIGSSFYFIWLDNSLDPPAAGSEEARRGVAGELWAVHGGGFYNPQKYAVAPARLPDKLHWFKWEAYTTWLSGTALLIVVYWLRAGTMMIDPNVSALGPWQAVAVGAASMAISWVVYDLLCRSPLGKNDALLGAVVFGLMVLLAWGLSRELGGRAAFIEVGASIGTIMVANVFFVIIPGQRRMVAAMREGQAPDPRDGRRGKQRSVHNNYFTLPVLFTMVSNHYASTYAHPYNWAVLALIAAAGVAIRHFFNRRHKGVLAWQYPALGAVLLGIVAWWT